MFSRESCHIEVIRMVIFNTGSVKMYRNVIPICIWCAGMEIPTFVRNIESAACFTFREAK